MEFEWDEHKNRNNVLKHGVSFEMAMIVFDDPDRLSETATSKGGEQRTQTMGLATPTTLLFVVHTERSRATGLAIVRIISARPASRKERLRYVSPNA